MWWTLFCLLNQARISCWSIQYSGIMVNVLVQGNNTDLDVIRTPTWQSIYWLHVSHVFYVCKPFSQSTDCTSHTCTMSVNHSVNILIARHTRVLCMLTIQSIYWLHVSHVFYVCKPFSQSTDCTSHTCSMFVNHFIRVRKRKHDPANN